MLTNSIQALLPPCSPGRWFSIQLIHPASAPLLMLFHLEHPPFPFQSPTHPSRPSQMPSSLAFPLHCVIILLCGLNTVYFVFSCPGTCHPLPDGELPEGRDAPSYSGLHQLLGQALPSVLSRNATCICLLQPVHILEGPHTLPSSFSTTIQVDKNSHSSFVIQTRPGSEADGPLNAATTSPAHLSPLPTACLPPLFMSSATESQVTLPFGSRNAQILVLKDLRKPAGVLYL